jgi:hypothetical protein
MLLFAASYARAELYGPTDLECSAGVFWGDDTLTITNEFASDYATISASYGDGPYSSYFSGAAVASAEYGRVYLALTVGAMPSIYSQQASRATARFTDTFVASGPIGTGTVYFSAEEQTDITTVVLIGDQTNSSYATSSMTVVRNGTTNEPIGITFGAPFTFSYGIEGQAGFEGTNQNTIEVRYEYIRRLIAMAFTDADGSNVTDNVTIVSESGSIYPKSPALWLTKGDTNLIISWHSVTNINYSIASTESLNPSGWSVAVTNIIGTGSTNHVNVQHGTDNGRFLRLEIQ